MENINIDNILQEVSNELNLKTGKISLLDSLYNMKKIREAQLKNNPNNSMLKKGLNDINILIQKQEEQQQH